MTMRIAGTALVASLGSAGVGFAQQKGQYILGTNGLNAGIQPAPGFAYSNETFFGADRLKGANSQPIPVNGSFDLRIDQNFFIYTSPWKLLGGTRGGMFDLAIANGSVVAPQIGASGGGAGISDTYVQPFTLGYHFPRVEFCINFGFIAPTGRFRPLLNATNNIGSGYWGYLPSISSTIYLTKNKGTIPSVFSAYEFHGKKRYTNITPGQTYDLEWGLGQALPIKTHLLQFGVVGYGQWQTSRNGGTQPASLQDTRYKVAAVGAAGIFYRSQMECEFLLPVRAGIRRQGPCGRDHVDLRWRGQFSCCEMMSPPKSRYCSSATVPPASPTAMGS